MSRLFFAFFFLLASPALFAQVYEKAFGLEFGPHQGNRRISAGVGVTQLILERQDSLESGRGGYSFGITYDVRSDKIGFTTGIRYLETGYEVAEQFLRNDLDRSFSQTIRATYLSIPFEVNFHQSITEKDRVFFVMGLAANVHLKTRFFRTDFDEGIQTDSRELPEDPNERFRSPVISLNTGLGYDRKLNDKWSIRVQPYFQFFLQGNLSNDNDRTNRNYYQLGGRVTVRKIL